MVIRDDYERGRSKEIELERTIIDICRLRCCKNKDPYDIDLVINLHEDRKILIEVEETSNRYWPSDSPKPRFPSGLLTMPVRKVKYFIDDFKKLERKSINSIEEFVNLYPRNTSFRPKSGKDEIRLYIKGSYNLKYLSIVKEDTIVRSLNGELEDQELVAKRIEELKQRKRGWKFFRNLWYNPFVKNMRGRYRDDPVVLIVGLINGNNDIIWIERGGICAVLKELTESKWGI